MFAQPSYALARCVNYDIYTNTITTINCNANLPQIDKALNNKLS